LITVYKYSILKARNDILYKEPPMPLPPDPVLPAGDEALEARITELAAHIHAATYRLLTLIAELDRREICGTKG
jgi:hypothetical protein